MGDEWPLRVTSAAVTQFVTNISKLQHELDYTLAWSLLLSIRLIRLREDITSFMKKRKYKTYRIAVRRGPSHGHG